MVFVGIDPSTRKHGFWIATLDYEQKRVETLCIKNIAQLFYFIKEIKDKEPFVCIEDSSLQNVTFLKNASPQIIARLSRNAGMNQGISRATVQICQAELGEERVYPVSPKEKGRKKSLSIIASILNQEGLPTELKYRNQDALDAIALALRAKKEFTMRNKRFFGSDKKKC